MPALWTYSVRDLIPQPDPFDRSGEPDIRVHRLAQTQLARKYRRFQREAVLTATFTVADRPINVSGRIDGFRLAPSGVILYEIKPVPGNPRQWLGQPELQQARWQLQLYVDLAAHAAALPWQNRPIAAAFLYLVGDDGKHATEEVDLAAASGMLSRRLETVLTRAASHARRDARSGERLTQFIYRDRATDRPAQQIAGAQLATLDSPRPILLSMPPGSGKTRIALRYGLSEAFRLRLPLYWITTKARGRDEVLAELARYSAAVPLRVVWKTIAERLCHCGLSPSDCPINTETRSRLFFDSLPDLRSRVVWNPDDLIEYADAHVLCPHELARELQPAADVVIADVNYLLHPSSLRRHPAVIVLDEAQNLADRIFENSHVRISREEFLALAHELPTAGRRLVHSILSAELWEVDGPDAAREQWLLLDSMLIAGHSALPVASAIRRAARLWNVYPADYTVCWYRGSSPALIGTLLNATAAIEKLLATDAPVIALSGSLPAEGPARESVIPAVSRFHCLEVRAAAVPPVAIVPLLEFRHPLRSEDHEAATDALRELRAHFPPTIAVFGQNRASNEFLSWRLRVRGFTILLDEDIVDDWSSVQAAATDFLFISLGGSLSESVNPPPGLFSAAAILAPGHRAPDEFDLLRSLSGGSDQSGEEVAVPRTMEIIAHAVSRLVQAAGRVQRSPESPRPVVLLNRSFAEPDYLHAWPRPWYDKSPHELVSPSLSEALSRLKSLCHA